MVLNKLKVKDNNQSKDLINLIYKASHDLKGPLRTVKSFTQILSKSLEDRIKTDEKDLFNYIFEATSDLENLIVQLVTLSKISQTPINVSEVNFGHLAELIKLNLKQEIEASGANVKLVYADEKIFVDREKMGLVLRNLLSNAIKFQPKNQQAEINLSILDEAVEWKIMVSDNGIGIQEQHFETIFKPFEKLNGNSEFKGAGIGLAICERIVKDHKGSISLISEFEKGSTFTIRIPK